MALELDWVGLLCIRNLIIGIGLDSSGLEFEFDYIYEVEFEFDYIYEVEFDYIYEGLIIYYIYEVEFDYIYEGLIIYMRAWGI